MKALIAAALAFATTLQAQDLSRIPPADKDEAARLLKIYRENTDLEAREKAVEMMLNMHKTVVQTITPIIEKDWQTAVTNYRAALQKLTVQYVQKKKADPAYAKEVKLHRDKLAKLRATTPKKEQLADEGLASLGKLRGMHTFYLPDLVALQPSFHDMGNVTRALTRIRTGLKAKVTKLQNNVDFTEKDLEREEAIAIANAFWSVSGGEGVLKANAALLASKAVPQEEADAVRQLNEVRLLLGLAPCFLDPKLHLAAREHSKDMATANFFDHESPTPGRKTFADRAKLAGTTAMAENIAMGIAEPAEVIQHWFASPAHHLIMLGDYKRVGIGRHEMHWTLLVGN